MGRKLRFAKEHEAQKRLGLENAWAQNRIAVLSDRVDVLFTRERIEIRVNYAVWRTIEALDERGLAIACAEIARQKWAPVSHIADAFGVSRPTIYRWMEKLDSAYVPSDNRKPARELGDLGLSNRMVRYVRQHLDLSDEDLVERVWEEFGRPIDVYGVRRLREEVGRRQRHKDHNPPPPPPPSGQRTLFDLPPSEPEPEKEPTEEVPSTEPPSSSAVTVQEPALPPGRHESHAAGLTLALPWIAKAGLAETLRTLVPDQALDLVPSVFGLIGLSLLGIRSPEGAKEVHRRDFAPLTATAAGLPLEEELRRMSRVLASHAETLMEKTGQNMALALKDPEKDPIVYVDGHFLPYSGYRKLAHGYSTRFRQTMRGHMATYLHLRTGAQARPLFFAVSGGDDPFRSRVLELAARFREATGQVPLLVFDRGGSGWSMIEALATEGQPFACYQANPDQVMAKYLPDPDYAAISLRREGKAIEAEAAQTEIERGGHRVFLHAVRFDGRVDQVLVLATSVDAPTEEVLPILWGRWGIENSFKLYSQFGLNHLGAYGVLTPEEVVGEDPERLCTNPTYAKLSRRVTALEKDLVWLEESVGTRTGKGGLVLGLGNGASARDQRRWESLRDQLQATEEALERTPTRVTWAELVQATGREAFDYGPKMVGDVLRVVALNAEHAVRDVICEDYPNLRHERRLARMLLSAPGFYEVEGSTLTVSLREPDRPRFRRAARHLVDRLTSFGLRHPLAEALTLRWTLHPQV